MSQAAVTYFLMFYNTFQVEGADLKDLPLSIVS